MKAPAADERSIIDGLKASDALAIDDFVNRYSKPLFGVILNYLKDPADAEEVLQETLLKVVRKIGTFREESHLWPWMKRIAINNCIMWLRKHRTVREREVQMEEELPQFNRDGYHKTLINDWPVDPESIALNSELSQRLYDAIQSLPPEYRVPLVLRDVEGYSIREIASLLDLKEATTKTRIHRARLFVREKLSTYFEGR
jgi:RNA polymerase sigma-70 factor (ECF subfamily)